MNDRTLAVIERLGQVEWFRNVGVVDTNAAIVLTSWNEAIARCSAIEWENLTLDAANAIGSRVLAAAPKRFQQWNDVVHAVKPAVIALVARKIERVMRENDLPKVFDDCVQWDVLNLAMECEYSDIVPPAFFSAQSAWYLHGHFPCGWEGTHENGRPVIY